MAESNGAIRLIQSDRVAFLRSWLEDPRGVASVVPSGKPLARRMCAGLGPESTVVELGAGTGTVTAAIREAGVRDSNVHLVERDPRLAGILSRRFPDIVVHCIDAEAMEQRLAALAGRVDVVVSGLPILWFDRPTKTAILRAAFALLRAGGAMHQFTYVGRSPVGRRLMGELELTATRTATAWLNVPPAFVYRFARAGGAA